MPVRLLPPTRKEKVVNNTPTTPEDVTPENVTPENIDTAWKAVPSADLVQYQMFPLVMVNFDTRRVVGGVEVEEEAFQRVAELPKGRYFTADNPRYCPQLPQSVRSSYRKRA